MASSVIVLSYFKILIYESAKTPVFAYSFYLFTHKVGQKQKCLETYSPYGFQKIRKEREKDGTIYLEFRESQTPLKMLTDGLTYGNVPHVGP